MPLLPAAPPQPVTGSGGFDYVTVDAVHRRVYAAHGGAASLLIVDADSGMILGHVRVGPMAGSAPNLQTGTVYTGDGDGDAVSEVDPATLREVHRVAVAGPVDAIAYDPQLQRIYADEDDGTRVFVIDSRTFRQIGVVPLPGHKPEYLAINPATHEVYQNITDRNEFVIIDPRTLAVSRTVATPEIVGNHPLQYDAAYDEVIVGGTNGKLAGYTTSGAHLWTLNVPRMDQCTLDEQRQHLACAGSGKLTFLEIRQHNAPAILAQLDVSPQAHTVGIDPKTGDVWLVWGTRRGQPGDGSIQRFRWSAPSSDRSVSGADKQFMSAMTNMHSASMNVHLTGEADHDFIALMIAHHQAAVDMARSELKYGKDPKIRALARSILTTQTHEIVQMRAWLQSMR